MPDQPPYSSEDAATRPPLISALLAYAPMLLLLAVSMAAMLLPPRLADDAIRFDIILAGTLLCFFAGVRRGLSFRQPGGATAAQITTALLLFGLGFVALLLPAIPALFMLLTGYVAIWFLDPAAARRHEVPQYFNRLRRKQISLPILGIILLIIKRLNLT